MAELASIVSLLHLYSFTCGYYGAAGERRYTDSRSYHTAKCLASRLSCQVPTYRNALLATG